MLRLWESNSQLRKKRIRPAGYPFYDIHRHGFECQFPYNHRAADLDGTALIISLLPATVQSCTDPIRIGGHPYNQFYEECIDLSATTVLEAGDMDIDEDIDGTNLSTMASEYGIENCSQIGGCLFDLNNDDRVDENDLMLFGLGFGKVDCIKCYR